MEELEQPIIENNGSNEGIGKFKDAESLYKAYSHLEAEFTKKSQRLATLEKENESRNFELNKRAECEKRVDEFVTKYDQIKPFSSALKETLKSNENANLEEEAVRLLVNNYKSPQDYANDNEFLNNYIYSNQDIKDKIVKDYLSKITQNGPIKAENSGTSLSITPPNIPSTISEAGRMAKSIIKHK